MKASEVQKYLRDSLIDAATIANELAARESLLIPRIAIEIEPGPLNAIRSIATARALLESLRDTPADSVTGINIDIAHFCVDKIPISEIKGDSFLEQRVYHAHISDHGAGFFGDISLFRQKWNSTLLPLAKLQEWVAFLANHAALVNFSRTISVELEGTRSEKMAEESIRELHEWINSSTNVTISSNANRPAANP